MLLIAFLSKIITFYHLNFSFTMRFFLFVVMLTANIVFFARCEKDYCFTPPSPFALRVVDAEMKDLLNPAVSPNIKLTYQNTPGEQEVALEFQLVEQLDASTDTKIYYLKSEYLPWKSSEGVKTFKLYRDAAEPDVLAVDTQETTSDDCSYFVNHSVLYNGVNIKDSIDPVTRAYIAQIE